MRPLLALLAAAALLTGCGAEASDVEQEPDRLPAVTLPGIAGGEAVDLAEVRGPVVVNLWASYCVPCTRELPIYQQFSQEYDGRVDVLGIRFQDVRTDKADSMLREAGVTYPNVRDDDGLTRTRFLPRLLLVDARGEVVFDGYREIRSLAELEGLVAQHLGVAS